jgi:hypothetical protein
LTQGSGVPICAEQTLPLGELALPLSLYDVSIPLYRNMLRNVQAMLDKAEAHAREKGDDVAHYLETRLAEDMLPLSRQIQMISDAAKGGAARLAAATPPSMPDVETTWAELKERIAKTLAYVDSIKREDVDGGEDRTIELQFPGNTMKFTPRDFIFNFSIPNFLFHVTTAYGLLRHKGVPLGKMDFLAGGQQAG